MTRNLLFDLELLAHADYFVGTTKSGLSPIIEVRYLFCSPSDISPISDENLSKKWLGPSRLLYIPAVHTQIALHSYRAG